MKWINVDDQLPHDGKYVLARHNRGTWKDSEDQKNVNCVVVKLLKWTSHENDEYFTWEMFGPDSFTFTQITHWTPIEPLD